MFQSRKLFCLVNYTDAIWMVVYFIPLDSLLLCCLSWKWRHFLSHVFVAINTLRPRRNEQHFADDIFKCIFFNEIVWILIKISLKFVPKGPINNIPALVQIMAWCRSGDKPLSEPMMVSLPTHICVTRPQWVNQLGPSAPYMHHWNGWSFVLDNGLLPVCHQVINSTYGDLSSITLQETDFNKKC